MSTNAWLTAICALMVNAVLFGIGAVTVLSIPALSANAPTLLPAVIVCSIVLSPALGVLIAARMRYRNWTPEGWRRGDLISG